MTTLPAAFDLVCFSHLRWDFVYQRPQHLLSRCARDHRVFVVEEPIIDSGPARLAVRACQDNLWTAVPYLPSGLSDDDMTQAQQHMVNQLLAEHQIASYVLWYYTPMALPFTRHLQPAVTIYDCMDELSAFAGAAPILTELEAELFGYADLVFTGGQSLFEAKRHRHPQVYLFPSSVDRTHFGRARDGLADPADQAALLHPRLGFYGVIDERMDYNLLAEIADAQPEWQLIMVGPVAKVDLTMLPRRANIHYLGAKAYADLPAYLANWDVALLPFAHNDSTRFISPTKTPEYLAAGRPVVSTAIQDVVSSYGEQNLIHIADSAAAVVAAVKSALAQDADNSARWLERVDAFLETMSWDRTWRRMSRLINPLLHTPNGHDGASASSNGRDGSTTTTTANGPAGSTTIAKGHDASTSISNGYDASTSISNGHDASAAALKGVSDKRTEACGYTAYLPHSGTPFDYLIVGAGFAGCVLAERLAREAGKRVLITDKRNHIGGNAFDYYDDSGLLVHKYGPHIFHTNSADVFAYLSRFTQWRPYQHRVRAYVDGQLVPLPINLDTINQLYGLQLTSFQLQEFFASVAEKVEHVRTAEDVVVGTVGRELYEKFFRGYTRKQWGLDPSELDAAVTARIPTRINRDDRYFTDTYQAMPLHGYTRMFGRMLDHPNIKILLNTEYSEVSGLVPYHGTIYTGPIDEYFGYCYGKLPYRSLEFRLETHDVTVFQPSPVVNYPNDYAYTRVTEFKYLTGQEHAKTTVIYEYPCAEGDPYYPVPRPQNAAMYQAYKALADATPGVHFVGRLATYKYYNMDQVVAQALAEFARIMGVKRPHHARSRSTVRSGAQVQTG